MWQRSVIDKESDILLNEESHFKFKFVKWKKIKIYLCYNYGIPRGGTT